MSIYPAWKKTREASMVEIIWEGNEVEQRTHLNILFSVKWVFCFWPWWMSKSYSLQPFCGNVHSRFSKFPRCSLAQKMLPSCVLNYIGTFHNYESSLGKKLIFKVWGTWATSHWEWGGGGGETNKHIPYFPLQAKRSEQLSEKTWPA